jgi:CHAT domain-containing protein
MRPSSLNLCSSIFAALLLLTVQSGRSGDGLWDDSDRSFRAFEQNLDQLTEACNRGDYKGLAEASPGLLHDAAQFKRPDLQTRVLLLLGSGQLAASAYLSALRTFLPARDLSIRRHDYRHLYVIDGNIAWVYLEMNNLEAAGSFADQAMAAAHSAHRYNASLVISRAYIFALNQNFSRAEPLFSEAIFFSLNGGDVESAAYGWHLLAAGYYEAARDAAPDRKFRLLKKALPAAVESFRLRQTHHLPQLAESYRDLGRIYAGLGDLRTASVLMDRAIHLMSDPHSIAPSWYFYFCRGWLRVQKGDLAKALPDLRSALDLAGRLDVIPTDDDRVTFESGLAELYSLFIDAGNRLYLQNHDPALKAEIFEAAEDNRAASLRALVPQPNGWRTHLPAEYPALLTSLQSAERNLLSRSDESTQKEVRRLRAALHNDEVQAGSERETGGATALEIARRALDPDTAILTFHLGPQSSWLWTIAGDEVDVYQLPPKAEMAAAADRLTRSIRANRGWLAESDALSEMLFRQVPPRIRDRQRWIVALDQDLFSLPIAALRLNGQYLTEQHAILLAPSIRLLEPATSVDPIAGQMLGLGDAIYNRADERWPVHSFAGWLRRDPFGGNQANPLRLARLSGSGDEVRTALAIWGSGMVLTGENATREKLTEDLNSRTGILHLATHVIPAPQLSSFTGRPTLNNSRAGLIVLGLDGSGQPGFLDMRDIILRPVNLRLVVMSGCSSGDASALAASGLMGLTRAWLGAGASEVLATRWPVLDDSGPFFASFYRHLKEHPSSGAADALRAAQVEMIHSNSYRSRPDYWASYFLVGKV